MVLVRVATYVLLTISIQDALDDSNSSTANAKVKIIRWMSIPGLFFLVLSYH